MTERKSDTEAGTGATAGILTERPAPSRPGALHGRLDVFVGKWGLEGWQHEGLIGPAARVTGIESYEWLTGGFFLVHRLEGRLGDAEMACLEIIGHDSASDGYVLRTFYNDGNASEWRMRERDNVWMLTGEWPLEDRRLKVRCTTAFADAGRIRSSKWEHSSDGARWQTFWDVSATRFE